MCAYAWENRDKMAESESPVGWMYRTLAFKVRSLLREDRVWIKRLLQMSVQHSTADTHDFRLRLELQDMISPEDYWVLKTLYLDGYTYAETAAAMGLKKSALAMRVNRAKAKIRDAYCDKEKILEKSRNKCEQSPPGGHYIVEEAHGDGT